MNTIKFLRILYASELLTAGLLVFLFETELVPAGLLAGDAALVYALTIAGVVLTLACVPLAMKLLNFGRIKRIVAHSEQDYMRWCILRMAILETPLLYNLIGYYLLGSEPSLGYLALIVVVAFLFIWPSRDRMVYERELTYDQEEEA